ncbi:MAG: Gfo/Idh/MocA family oxidoreductase, partial [Pseudomonadota bacterium]
MIRIGLLGASRVGRGAIIAAAAGNAAVEVCAVAARSELRAREYADAHGLARVEPTYQALVDAADIDVVYNGLPPSEHKPWTLAALAAGKHVLCEKPFAMTAAEADAMVTAARTAGKTLLEAFHYRFHPLFLRLLELLEADAIGTVQRVDCRFNVPVPYAPAELRFDRRLGGGAMMDLGCYPVHWARTVVGTQPQVLRATADWHTS